ncbi:MAG: hypothetical protein CHACPFDD_02492 [Phycisphaerae bacterium]|nr:hypothetical protein [Phycisphaerae bacterium]
MGGSGSVAVDSFLICEDVRLEAQGQLSLVGVFGPVLTVPILPISFAKLALYVRVRGISPGIHPFTARVYDEAAETELISGTGKHREPEPASSASDFRVMFAAVQVSSWGPLRFDFDLESASPFSRSMLLQPPSWDTVYVPCKHCKHLVPSGVDVEPGARISLRNNLIQCSHCGQQTPFDDTNLVRLTSPKFSYHAPT